MTSGAVYYYYRVDDESEPREGTVPLAEGKVVSVGLLLNAIWELSKENLKEFQGIAGPENLRLWLRAKNKRLTVKDKLGEVFGDAADKEVDVTPSNATSSKDSFVKAEKPGPSRGENDASADALTSRKPTGLPYDGLGGTVYRTSREKTVQGIADAVLEEGVVVIRGPPQSGKTCLVELLADHFRNKPGCRVDHLCMRSQRHRISLDEVFTAAFNTPWTEYVDDKAVVKVLLVDEAQILFDVKRWNSKAFVDYTRVKDPWMKIVLACVQERFVPPTARTEVRLWTFPYRLTLTDYEYDELWDAWLEVRRLQLPDCLKDYVGRICRMQPGLVCPVLDYLHEQLVWGGIPSEKHGSVAVEKLKSYSFYANMKKKIRSMTDLKNPYLVDFLLWLSAKEGENVIASQLPAQFAIQGHPLDQCECYATTEDDRISFVSPLHRMVFLIHHFELTSKARSTLSNFDGDLGKFITSAVASMGADALATSAARRVRIAQILEDEF